MLGTDISQVISQACSKNKQTQKAIAIAFGSPPELAGKGHS